MWLYIIIGFIAGTFLGPMLLGMLGGGKKTSSS
jgi:hypothetical protein